MKTLVAFPGSGGFAQQVALAFLEADALSGFYTSFAYDPDGRLARMIRRAPGGVGGTIDRELRRRRAPDLPPGFLRTRPFWEIVRILAAKTGASPPVVDQIWDHLSRSYTRYAATHLPAAPAAFYAYEYTALEAFEAAGRQGVARILDLPSLNSRQFEVLQRREQEAYPELTSPHDAYFRGRFEERQARRDAEVALADVIITNSNLTRDSHIAAGADPQKTFAVPLGAPPTISAVERDIDTSGGKLNLVWAGTLSLRKGAHYLLDAWRDHALHRLADLSVYGAVQIPRRLMEPALPGVTLHGSVVQPTLFAAFQAADALVFPTLSDGFGMVVTEAFARGLPVITTDQAGAADLVEHGRNGLIIPAGDSAAIADAVQWCADNRSALHEMRLEALRTARNWQWSDYRRGLISAVDAGLRRAGFTPDFRSSAAT